MAGRPGRVASFNLRGDGDQRGWVPYLKSHSKWASSDPHPWPGVNCSECLFHPESYGYFDSAPRSPQLLPTHLQYSLWREPHPSPQEASHDPGLHQSVSTLHSPSTDWQSPARSHGTSSRLLKDRRQVTRATGRGEKAKQYFPLKMKLQYKFQSKF